MYATDTIEIRRRVRSLGGVFYTDCCSLRSVLMFVMDDLYGRIKKGDCV